MDVTNVNRVFLCAVIMPNFISAMKSKLPEIAKLTARIGKLEKDLSQCRHEKKLAHRNSKYNKDQGKKLSDTLAQLKKKSLLDEKVIQFVEVSSFITSIFIFTLG